MEKPRIAIIGVGRVGSTIAQLCAYQQLGNLVLIDKPPSIAEGVALDLMHSQPLEQFGVTIKGTGDYKEIEGSDVVCITAGIRRAPGTSRDDILLKNAEIVKNIVGKVAKHAPESKLLIVTNPLDAMTYVAYTVSGFPRERVLGMAGMLDAARFRAHVAQELNVHPKTVETMVIGGHGDRALPLIGKTAVNGKPLVSLLPKERIDSLIQKTRDAGDTILALENGNSAYYAPASSIIPVVRAILQNTHETLPCSAYMQGEYGLRDVCIGVPVQVGKDGMERIVELPLTDMEKKWFADSAKGIKDSLTGI